MEFRNQPHSSHLVPLPVPLFPNPILPTPHLPPNTTYYWLALQAALRLAPNGNWPRACSPKAHTFNPLLAILIPHLLAILLDAKQIEFYGSLILNQ